MRPKHTSMGSNRTGITVSPGNSRALIEGAAQGCADAPPGDATALEQVREAYGNDAEPIGTAPAPTTQGRGLVTLLDKLGERLAFERTGTRLYEALLAKFDTSPSWQGGPTRAELVQFRADELAHFGLLRDAVLALGADPTVQTPAADVVGVASMGVLQVVTEPRTTLPQSLDALLTAELTDNDGWQMLIDLARATGHGELAARFERAQRQEEIHLASVRRWLSAHAIIASNRAATKRSS